jgi:hypothetical protein
MLKEKKYLLPVFMKGIFGDSDDIIEFDIVDKDLMSALQNIASEEEIDLIGNGVFVEINFEEGYEGATLFGNFDREGEEGDAFFHVDRNGIIVATDFD